METAAIIADLRKLRCGHCKVLLHDLGAIACPACGATFHGISSNHSGLARKLQRERDVTVGKPQA